MPDNPENKNSSHEKTKKPDSPSENREEKLNSAVWLLLGTGAVMIDFAQVALDAFVIGFVLNIFIDIFVGLSLAFFFAINKMLDLKLAVSLLLGFALDFISAGILPAWSADIAYAWLVTDGSSKLGKVPVVGEAVEKAAKTALKK